MYARPTLFLAAVALLTLAPLMAAETATMGFASQVKPILAGRWSSAISPRPCSAT
ncbi:MAG TPA: hypothetical protein VD994_00515 [Prosthecobacter sp.]|nr:hypothetical protein [Prosthecobacter sp.]